MTERREPQSDMDRFVDSADTDAALGEFMYISRRRSEAHAAVNLFRDYHVRPEDSPEHPLRQELQAARGLLARWALMCADMSFRTVDLARIENQGDWTATDGVEAEMEQLASCAYQAGQSEGLILRNAAEAKLRVTVDPTMVSCNGLAIVRRKRLMLRTMPEVRRFRDVRPRVMLDSADCEPGSDMLEVQTRLEIDKVSEFIINMRRMREVDAGAADEIQAIINSSSPAEITNQDYDLCSPRVVEEAIDGRDPMLVPAVTTYYADRKYSNIRRLSDTPVDA